MSRFRSAAALAVTSTLALAVAPPAVSARPLTDPAPAATLAACPRGTGVSVVVDFGATSKTLCATGDPATGLAALRGAGFRTVMVQRFPGMVCRINGIPSATKDACVVAPPSSAYWSYWHAKRGGVWTYSAVGAGSYNPKPGTVEGWSYGAGKPPSTPPPAIIASR